MIGIVIVQRIMIRRKRYYVISFPFTSFGIDNFGVWKV